jgi:hypothetical protein
VVWRIVLTLVAWFLGLASVVTDGQSFTGALLLIGATVLGSLPWLIKRPARETATFRVGLVVLGLSSLVCVVMLLGLPDAYRAQRAFNSAARSQTTSVLR